MEVQTRLHQFHKEVLKVTSYHRGAQCKRRILFKRKLIVLNLSVNHRKKFDATLVKKDYKEKTERMKIC